MKKLLLVFSFASLLLFCKAQDAVLHICNGVDIIKSKSIEFNTWKNNDSTYCYYVHLRDSLNNELSKVERNRKKREILEFELKKYEAIIKLYISSYIKECKMNSESLNDTIK